MPFATGRKLAVIKSAYTFQCTLKDQMLFITQGAKCALPSTAINSNSIVKSKNCFVSYTMSKRLYDLARNLARILARKDQQTVGNKVLPTIISSISDKRNQLVELPDSDHEHGTDLHCDQTTCTSQISNLQVLY